jgi:Lar family restriction alleviation protein
MEEDIKKELLKRLKDHKEAIRQRAGGMGASYGDNQKEWDEWTNILEELECIIHTVDIHMVDIETALKLCPFCGSKTIVIVEHGPKSYCVECDDCSAEVWGNSENKAIEAWNRRQADGR